MTIPTLLEVAALAEYDRWRERLELERWTTSGQDPQVALKELIARESPGSPAFQMHYRHQPKGKK